MVKPMEKTEVQLAGAAALMVRVMGEPEAVQLREKTMEVQLVALPEVL